MLSELAEKIMTKTALHTGIHRRPFVAGLAAQIFAILTGLASGDSHASAQTCCTGPYGTGPCDPSWTCMPANGFCYGQSECWESPGCPGCTCCDAWCWSPVDTYCYGLFC